MHACIAVVVARCARLQYTVLKRFIACALSRAPYILMVYEITKAVGSSESSDFRPSLASLHYASRCACVASTPTPGNGRYFC